MIRDDEKRNVGKEIEREGAAPGLAAGGVGGRQVDPPPPARGGGYLNTCMVLNFRAPDQKKRDPRLDELQRMGLQRVWLDVAEAIGVDNMLTLWRILDADYAKKGADLGRVLVPIRTYSTYLRYQRNRYIETLQAMSIPPAEIRDRVHRQLGEKLSMTHLYRILQKP